MDIAGQIVMHLLDHRAAHKRAHQLGQLNQGGVAGSFCRQHVLDIAMKSSIVRYCSISSSLSS
jgi:hypothetical protein